MPPITKPSALKHQLKWFALLWLGGLLTTAVVAYGLKWLLKLAS